jgi:hypothetical protein
MAVQSAILVPAGDAVQKVSALAATTSSAALVLGTNRIFAINADQDITIRFGNAGLAAADATFYRIPANQQTTLDLSDQFTQIRVFNLSSSTAANVWVLPLSRF